MAKNIEMNLKLDTGSYEILYPQTLGSLVSGKVSSASMADTATSATTADSATTATSATSADKLSTSRNLEVNLGLTGSQSFDGSKDAINIGVYNVLQPSNGGTGTTDISYLANSLKPYISSDYKNVVYSYQGNGQSSRTITIYDNIRIMWVFRDGTGPGGYALMMCYMSPNVVAMTINGMSKFYNVVTWNQNYIYFRLDNEDVIGTLNSNGTDYYLIGWTM